MRRQHRYRIVLRWTEVVIAAALFVVMVSAILRWPDKIIADVAIPTAGLIVLFVWRDHVGIR
jgi:hypothetical protein